MLKNVMVAVDGSPHAARAVTLGSAIATKFGVPLHLVHVVAHPMRPEDIQEFARSERVDDPAQIAIAQVGESVLGVARADATVNGVRDVRTHVLAGDPAGELLRYAQEHGIDLIVMGRRGLGRISGLLVGSVSSKVNSLAECSVATVK